MNKGYLLSAAAASSLLVSACAPQTATVPEPVAHPYTEQLVMQSAHHWEVLAGRIAERVNEYWPRQSTALSSVTSTPSSITPIEIISDDTASSTVTAVPVPAVTTSVPVETAPTVVEFDFSQGVPTGNSLGASSVAAPTTVSVDPVVTTSIAMPSMPQYSLYVNPPRRGQDAVFGNSFHNMLKAELVKRNIIVTNNPDNAGTFCTQLNSCRPLILDYDIHLADNPHVQSGLGSELIVSTSIMDGDVVVFGESRVYYLDGVDNHLYEQNTKTFRVVNK